jgi:hypothetical protein
MIKSLNHIGVWPISLIIFTIYPGVAGTLSVFLTIVAAINLFSEIGKSIPIVQLTVFFSCLQYLLCPFLEYTYFQNYIDYEMAVPTDVYYSYTITAIVSLVLALRLKINKKAIAEPLVISRIRQDTSFNYSRGLLLSIIGLVAEGTSSVVNSNQLNFVFHLIGFFGVIGILYLLLSDKKGQTIGLLFLAVYCFRIIQSTIFVNLIVLLLLLLYYFNLNRFLGIKKNTLIIASSVILFFLIQSVKGDYRLSKFSEYADKEDDISTLSSLIEQKGAFDSKDNFLTTASQVNSRLNQGWMLSLVMNNIPSRQPYFRGTYFFEEFIGVLVPRFLYSQKATVQTNSKFVTFTNYPLNQNTTMTVGVLGDGYGNFGSFGGALFCFCFGLTVNLLLSYFHMYYKVYPHLILWIPFIFWYVFRAGDDYYIISNWLSKSLLLLLVFYKLYPKILNSRN